LLCKVKTREEVLEYSAAFLQLYREEAFYLDRTVHYVQRVGLDYIKKNVVEDAARRKELNDRLLDALKDYEDPWKKAVDQTPAQPLRRQFEIIEIV
jgi:nitrite reductase (NADH) large subunit